MFQGLFLYRERYSLQICTLFRTKCVFNSSRTAKGRQFHVRFVLAPICVVGGGGGGGGRFLFMLFAFIYVYWCPTQFPYQMMFVSSNRNTAGVTCGAGTTNPSGAQEFTRPRF